MRRLVGIVLLLAIAASPAVARARVFCRFTGDEVTTDCEELRVPERAVVQKEGCCERRVAQPLDAARVTSPDLPLPAPLLAGVPAMPVMEAQPPMPAQLSRPPATGGPPLFLLQRSLLI